MILDDLIFGEEIRRLKFFSKACPQATTSADNFGGARLGVVFCRNYLSWLKIATIFRCEVILPLRIGGGVERWDTVITELGAVWITEG